MHRVLLNFQDDVRQPGWNCHFVEADCQTLIGPRTKYYHFPTLEALRAFLIRCKADSAALSEFERCIKSWGKGSVFVTLTDEQYIKVRRASGLTAPPRRT